MIKSPGLSDAKSGELPLPDTKTRITCAGLVDRRYRAGDRYRTLRSRQGETNPRPARCRNQPFEALSGLENPMAGVPTIGRRKPHYKNSDTGQECDPERDCKRDFGNVVVV